MFPKSVNSSVYQPLKPQCCIAERPPDTSCLPKSIFPLGFPSWLLLGRQGFITPSTVRLFSLPCQCWRFGFSRGSRGFFFNLILIYMIKTFPWLSIIHGVSGELSSMPCRQGPPLPLPPLSVLWLPSCPNLKAVSLLSAFAQAKHQAGDASCLDASSSPSPLPPCSGVPPPESPSSFPLSPSIAPPIPHA